MHSKALLQAVLRRVARLGSAARLRSARIRSAGSIRCATTPTLGRAVTLEARTNSHISLDGTVNLHDNCLLRAFGGGRLVVGDGCGFNNNCFIAAGESVTIGRDVQFGPNVVVVDHNHDYRHPDGLKAGAYRTGEIVIGDNVWVGANAVILRNTRIGAGAVIGAGCVVSGVVPPNTVLICRQTQSARDYTSDE